VLHHAFVITFVFLTSAALHAQSTKPGQFDFSISIGQLRTKQTIIVKSQPRQHKFIPVVYSNHDSPWSSSVTFGLGGTLWFVDRLGLGIETVYQRRASDMSSDFEFQDMNVRGRDHSVRVLSAIAFPIQLTYRLIDGPIRLDLSSGVEYAIAFEGSSRIVTTYAPPNDDLNSEESYSSVQDDDVGLLGRMSISYPLSEKFAVGARYTYVHGLTDHGLMDYTEKKWKNQQVSILITVHK
jgi:hypothetical protein